MIEKLGLCFGVLALAAASAATANYQVTLFQPSVIAGAELTPGEYRVSVDEHKAIIKSGKKMVEANVKVENADRKYRTTSVVYSNRDGKYLLQEIHIGGTHMKLVFENQGPQAAILSK